MVHAVHTPGDLVSSKEPRTKPRLINAIDSCNGVGASNRTRERISSQPFRCHADCMGQSLMQSKHTTTAMWHDSRKTAKTPKHRRPPSTRVVGNALLENAAAGVVLPSLPQTNRPHRATLRCPQLGPSFLKRWQPASLYSIKSACPIILSRIRPLRNATWQTQRSRPTVYHNSYSRQTRKSGQPLRSAPTKTRYA